MCSDLGGSSRGCAAYSIVGAIFTVSLERTRKVVHQSAGRGNEAWKSEGTMAVLCRRLKRDDDEFHVS
jgi:hypothetical protein